MKHTIELDTEDVTYTLECLSEDSSIEGNALASGDPDMDTAAESWIEQQIAAGNPWAWCTAKVTAEWCGVRGYNYLGCCSYASEADFRAGPYFEGMKTDALADLLANLGVTDAV